MNTLAELEAAVARVTDGDILGVAVRQRIAEDGAFSPEGVVIVLRELPADRKRLEWVVWSWAKPDADRPMGLFSGFYSTEPDTAWIAYEKRSGGCITHAK